MRGRQQITAGLERLALAPARWITLPRTAVADPEAARRETQRQAIFDRYAVGAARQQQTFFSRFSNKYGPRQPLHRASVAARVAANPRGPANALADNWTPVLHQEPCGHNRIREWFADSTTGLMGLDFVGLLSAVSVGEVLAAIGSLGAGKACGPDLLCYEFYKDNTGRLAPHLAALFKAVLEVGQAPSSFTESEIYCIHKVTKPQSGLDCRPIALLNGDYKPLARVLATRLGPHLEPLIHETQNGFALGRNIHDTIDVLSAARLLLARSSHSRAHEDRAGVVRGEVSSGSLRADRGSARTAA
ncbi:hypothetical protein PybrP1_000098 [[Pythium] brassicae (nom. inval.)]|nr:hypothetical protein PybrP1_000098 [[Pythium] brassicae (nom. inval.)]